MKFSRRKFLRYSLAAGGIVVGTGFYVRQIEPHWVAYEQQSLSIPNLPDELVGKKLVQFSDLHIGRRVSDKYLENQFEYVNSLKPEFVVYTGDFIDQGNLGHHDKLKNLAPQFARGTLGTAGVLGNHDYQRHTTNIDIALKVANTLNDAGIQILFNETQTIAGITFAGLEDFWSPRFQVGASRNVIQSLPPCSVVLSHNPDTADLPIWNGYQSWVLCGHTHGGQCRAPGFRPPFLPVRNKNYVSGIYQLPDGFQMYINRGLGHKMKVRFCARPEVTVFTLSKLGSRVAK